MRKHLLFAAMLTLGAAPVFATQTAATCYAVAAEEETSTAATEAEYEALQSAITDAIAKIDEMSKSIAEKYPESEVLGSLEYTKSALQEMSAEAKTKKDAGTLTSKEVADYQNTVKEYSDGVANAEQQAEIGEYEAQVFQHYMAAQNAVSAAMEMPESVANYYYNSVDSLSADLNTIYNKTYSASTADDYKAIFAEFDAVALKADTLSQTITAAAELVDDINATLKTLDADIEKVKTDFPDYDLTYTLEDIAVWEALAKEFSAAPKDNEEIYGIEDIETYAQSFGWFKEGVENFYSNVQMEEFMAQFNEKYYPVSSTISEYQMSLYEECTHLDEEGIAKYYNALDDLTLEMSQMYYVLYGDPITQAEFDKMLTRVDEIAEAAKEIYAEALAADKAVATGINSISAEGASAKKVYTLDGKAVESVKGLKGVYIVNGKKVILK